MWFTFAYRFDYIACSSLFLFLGDEIILPPMSKRSCWELFCHESGLHPDSYPSVDLFRTVFRTDPMFKKVRIPRNAYGAIKCKTCERYKMKVM